MTQKLTIHLFNERGESKLTLDHLQERIKALEEDKLRLARMLKAVSERQKLEASPESRPILH